MELNDLILPFFSVFLAGLIEGLVGFGFALVAMPLLTLIFSLQQVVPMIFLMNMSVSFILVWQTRKCWSSKALVPILLSSLMGLPIGLMTLKYVNEAYLKIVAGIFIIIVALLFIRGTQLHFRNKNQGFIIAGFLSGFFGACISLAGPPVVMILNNYDFSKDEFRGTLSMLFFSSGILALGGFLASDLLTIPIATQSASLVPALFIGAILGILLSKKINPKFFTSLTHLILLVMGGVTFFNGLSALL